MKIKAVCEVTKLTDRTIRYYIEEELISPKFTENYMGRRTFDFTEQDVKAIQDIAVLRKYGFSINEIKEMIIDPWKIPKITKDLETRKRENVNEETELLEKLNQAIHTENYSITDLAEFLSKPVEEKIVPEEKISIAKIIKRYIKISIRAIIVLLPIIASAIGAFFAITKYIHITVQWVNVVLALLLLIPSIILITIPQKASFKKVLLILCIVLPIPCFINAICTTASYSATTDIKDYREIDPTCYANTSTAFHQLFPKNADYFKYVENDLIINNTNYYYYYKGYWDDDYDIFVEWPLKQDELNIEVSRVETTFKDNENLIKIKKGNWTCIMIIENNGLAQPFESVHGRYEYYVFAYNEETLKVRYIASQSMENDLGEKQPYYLSLEW